MSDAPWTPGPWATYGRRYVNVAGTEEPIATVDEPDPDMQRADARLIAAAPEMAEVLASINHWGVASVETVDKAREIYARIRGGA